MIDKKYYLIFFKDIHKEVLYLYFSKPERPTIDEMIRWLEGHIEDIKKGEKYFDKENTLKRLNNILERLKQIKM